MDRRDKTMTEKETCSDQTADLRKRAEEIVREKVARSPEDTGNYGDTLPQGVPIIAQTLHELRVHQIELELQNDELRRAQAELDAARARYFDLYDLAPVGYCTISEPGLILEANLTAVALLGVARADLVKQPLSRFILKEDQDIYYRRRKQLFETGEPQACELRMVKSDGAPFWSRQETTVAQDADGAPLCRIVLSDITARKQAEEALSRSNEKTREILESITDAFFSLDDNMIVKYFNPAAERVLNRKADEVIGHHLFDAFPEAQGSVFEENYTQGIRTKKALFFEVEFSVAPYENCYDVRVYPEKNGISVFFQVTTEHKRIEKMEKARLRISSAINVKSSKELMQMALDEIEALTGSTIGFYHFILEDQETISLQAWSTNTLDKMCTAEGAGSHYPLSQGGVWTDCIRERRAVIHNDYNSLPHRKGMPPGHAPIMRELVVPIFRNERIVAIFGVGNRPIDYNDSDIHLIVSLGDFSWEIVERKRIEEALLVSEEKFSKAFQTSPYAIIITRAEDGRFIEVNDAFTLIAECTREEALADSSVGLRLWEHKEDREGVVADLRAGRAVEGREYQFRTKSGRNITGLFSARIINLNSSTCILSSINDITDRKKSEEQIKASLREKETLLKEVHHRVKNNLQIISSLLNMQARSIGNEKLEGIFRECQDRITAMASVHQLLYKSQNFAEINFGEYVRETASQLLRTYKTSSAAVSLVIHAENIMIPIDTAIPCGLIINELVTNSLKYAFPGVSKGEIKIEMSQTQQGISLVFADNGIGFPKDVDFYDTKTLGLKLIHMLVKQLDGTIEQFIDGGTKYAIMLKP